VSWESVGRPEDYPAFGPRHGVEAVRDFFRLVAENEDFSDFSPREFLAADDRVFVLGHYEATLRKTGRTVASDWVHVFTLRDRKVSRWREHTDTAQFAEAWRG
jgi:ketosteroid isomerase-like protein